MFYLIPAGAQQYTPQEDPLSSLQAPQQQQYQVGYDAMGNSVVYVAAPAPEQATAAPLIAADGSLLQPQVLSAQDLPLLYAAAQPGQLGPAHQHAPSEASPQMPSPATTGGGVAASSVFADAWGEPGYLSAPAAFPSADVAGSAASRVHQQLKLSSPPPPPSIQHAGLPTAAALAAAPAPPTAPPSLASLSGASLPLTHPHTLHPASLDLSTQLGAAPPLLASQPAPQNSSSNTAFLVHQLQQLRVQQQQQEQQKQRQMQVLQLKQQQQQQQQQQQGSNLLVQTNQLSAEQQAALTSGQPFQMNSNAQVSRLLSSIQNNSRRADTFKFGGGGARPSQAGQHHPLGKGPMSAPAKPPQHSGHKPPHALRAQPPSWAGSNWNPRFVGAPASSAGTGVFLPQVAQQELKAASAQQQQQQQTAPAHAGGPAPADGHHPNSHVGSQLAAQSGPPSMASPMDSNLSALSQPLSSHHSLYEDP